MTPTKVVLVCGWSRSGSTLLDLVLGRFPGFFSAGEVRYLWDRGILDDQRCGCGRTFSRCPVWQDVLRTAFGGRRRLDVEETLGRRRRLERDARRLLLGGPNRTGSPSASRAYVSTLGRLYRAIARVTGCRVVVDSSKYASHALALAALPEIDLRLVHLVRDSRAVAWSWQRRRVLPEIHWERATMPIKGPVRSAAYWSLENLEIGRLAGSARSFLRLRYEDLARHPEHALARVLASVDEPGDPSRVVRNGSVDLGENHTVAGNPLRFRRGATEIRPDVEWRSLMPAWQRWIVTAVSWPLLVRYGFVGRSAS